MLDKTASPTITFDQSTGKWDFEPFVVWLRNQGIFESFDEKCPLGPTPKNRDMIDTINCEQPYDPRRENPVYKLPAHHGDNIVQNQKSSQITTAAIVNSPSSDALRKLIFVSYAGMLEKFFAPSVVGPFIKHYCATLDLQEINASLKSYKGVFALSGRDLESGRAYDLQTKRMPPGIHRLEEPDIAETLRENPLIPLTVMAYYKALRDYTYQLQETIKQSPALSEKQKENGVAICNSVISNGIASNSPVLSKINSAVGLVYTMNKMNAVQAGQNKTEADQADFQQGMDFLRKQEFFKNGHSRCLGEASVLKLSGILSGANEAGGHAFGNTLYEMHQKLSMQLVRGSGTEKSIQQTLDKLMSPDVMRKNY